MKKLMLILSLFAVSVPTVQALPRLGGLPGLSQGGPRARIAAIRQRIQERRAARQARQDAAKAAQANQVQAVSQ